MSYSSHVGEDIVNVCHLEYLMDTNFNTISLW